MGAQLTQTPPSRNAIEKAIDANPKIHEIELRNFIKKLKDHKALAKRNKNTEELKKIYALEDKISSILQNKDTGRNNIVTEAKVLNSRVMPAQKPVDKVEKISTLSISEVQAISTSSLNNARLDPDKSIDLAAKYFKLPNSDYNEEFISKLKAFQKTFQLKEDGILGPNTIGILGITQGLNGMIELSTDKELIAFYNAIESNTVSEEMLISIEQRIKSYGEGVLSRTNNKTKGTYEDLNYGGENSMMLLSVFLNFKSKVDKDSTLYKNHTKRGELMQADLLKNYPQASNSLDGVLNGSPMNAEDTKRYLDNLAKGKAPASSPTGPIDPNSMEAKIGAAADEIKKNPLLMATAMIGFVMFLFGKRDTFAIAGFTGLLGVMGGPALIKTLKGVGSAFGIDIDLPGFDDDAVAKGRELTKKGFSWVEEKAKSLGVSTTKLKDNLLGKQKSIEEAIVAKYPKLDTKKIQTITSELSVDENFAKVSVDKISEVKISDLAKETQEKLKTEGVTEKSPEFKAYLKVLKDKISEEKSNTASTSEKINTVGEYIVDFNDKTKEVTFAVGIAGMGLGLITKSPTTFFVGTGVVIGSIFNPLKHFFDSSVGQSVVSEAESISNKYFNYTKDYIESKTGIPLETTKKIYKYIAKADFKGIRNLATLTNDSSLKTKILDIAQKSEQNYYSALVESKTHSFLPDFLKSIKDTAESGIVEIMDNYDIKIKSTLAYKEELQSLKAEIASNDYITNKNELLNSLESQIITLDNDVQVLSLEKENSKASKVAELTNELDTLNNRLTSLKEKTFADNDPEKFKNKNKIIRLEREIAGQQSKLDKAKKEYGDIKKATIEKPENIKRLETAISSINTSSEITDLFSSVSLNGGLAGKKLTKLESDVTYLLDTEKNYTGTNQNIKDLIGQGKDAYTKLIQTIEKIPAEVLAKVTNDKYPALEIGNLRTVLTTLPNLDVGPFNKSLLEKKTEVFNSRISNAEIDEIQVLRKEFGSVKGASKLIKERVAVLAKTDTGGNVETIRILIENSKIGGKDLDPSVKNLLSSTTIATLYTQLTKANPAQFNNREAIVSHIKEFYSEYDFMATKAQTKSKSTKRPNPRGYHPRGTTKAKTEDPKPSTGFDKSDSLTDIEDQRIRDMFTD